MILPSQHDLDEQSGSTGSKLLAVTISGAEMLGGLGFLLSAYFPNCDFFTYTYFSKWLLTSDFITKDEQCYHISVKVS